MNPFRAYLRIKIKEESLEQFVEAIPEMIQLVEETEPNALQYEAFVNRESNEIIWLESYKENTDYDLHLGNSNLDPIRMKIMPMQEAIHDCFFMDQPTDLALNGLKAYGIEPNVLTPIPGTNKLTEARGVDNVQTISMVNINNKAAFEKYIERLEKEVEKFPGFLFHSAYYVNDSKILGWGEWTNIETLMSWVNDKYPSEFGEEFQSVSTGMNMYTNCGKVTDDLLNLAKVWNTPCFERVAGFSRY